MSVESAKTNPAVALTISGSDSSGGAGAQADLKTFHRFGVFGTSALTLITAQNTVGVTSLHLLEPAVVRAQFDAVVEDFDVDAAKTGSLGSATLIESVALALRDYPIPNLVVDPVMVSKHGDPLLAPEAVEVLRDQLFPLASLITPNLHEASALLGRTVDGQSSMAKALPDLHKLGARAVLLKGGALRGALSVDYLFDGQDLVEYSSPRVETTSTHGSGCTFSAAITALLAKGTSLREAIRVAKAYMDQAIATAPGLGQGHGPVNHWAS